LTLLVVDHKASGRALNHLLTRHPVGADGLPLHVVTAKSATARRTMASRALGRRLHGTTGTVSGIEGSTTPGAAVVGAPASLAGEDSVVEAVECARASAVDKGSVAEDGNVVEAEVPNRGVDHAVGAESHESADDCTSENVVPVVELVNGESTTNQAGTEDRSVKGNKLPHGRVVVGEDLELAVEVEVEEHEAGESSSGVTRGHGLESVVDLGLVTRTDAAVEHDLAVAIGNVSGKLVVRVCVGGVESASWDDRLADGEEVGTKSSNEPLDEDLEDSGDNQGVEKTNGSVVDVPEAAHTDGADEEDDKRNKEGQESSSPDGDDLVAEGVSELGVDDLAVLEGDREAAARRGVSEVDTKTDGTKDSHRDNIKSGCLDPLAKGRARVPGASLMVGTTNASAVLARKDALLLLMGASGRGCVCRSSVVALVEETHVCVVGGVRVRGWIAEGEVGEVSEGRWLAPTAALQSSDSVKGKVTGLVKTRLE
jgi:hypothetical protein